MCKVLKVSRSGYYNWLHCSPSKRSVENADIIKRIISIHKESRQTYGSPRITAALKNESVKISRVRVARLMRKAKIKSKRKRRYITTTDSRHKYPIVENKLNRKFKVETIGKVWVSDITYIPTKEGWLYLTIIIDLADRKVIGWSLSETLKASDTSIAAYKMAVTNRSINKDLIFHSDRGIQYACTEFTDLLEKDTRIIRSMSRKGNCWDNAVAESFFKSLKSEIVYENSFKTIEDSRTLIFGKPSTNPIFTGISRLSIFVP